MLGYGPCQAGWVGCLKLQGLQGGLVCEDELGMSLQCHASFGQHDDALCLGRLGHVVGSGNDGHAVLVQFANRIENLHLSRWIKHRGCFVEQDTARAHGKCRSNG
jgi:D-mannonate dehydratase